MLQKGDGRFLTLALSKGKLLKPSLSFLKRVNLGLPSWMESDRRLVIAIPEAKMRILLIRATDLPTYVEHGVADFGIAGSDLLLEQEKDLYHLVDLPFGFCRLVLAGPPAKKEGRRSTLRIATKYPRVTQRYFSEKGMPVEIIKLYGSVELAPSVGLADQIVDLVESGKTLRAHGLASIDEIAQCHAQLVVNRASLRLYYKALSVFIAAFKRAAP